MDNEQKMKPVKKYDNRLTHKIIYTIIQFKESAFDYMSTGYHIIKIKFLEEFIMTKSPIALTNSRYRLGYHVAAPTGWINDPNGFCHFKGYYHIFYQHHPYSAEWGPMHWGHARSKDLVHWESLPIGLEPGSPEDKDGCFSGSAIVKDDIMYLFYTGHHYYNDGDPDYFWQNQNMAYSEDGIHFTKYENNPIIDKEPEDNTHHFRDPKVWEHEGTYYMILGSQENDGLGRAILYASQDLKAWDYLGSVSKATDLKGEGFMWECPDFFHLDGKDILLLSPQGIDPQEEKYLNLYQTGYFVGEIDYQTAKFTRGEFHELDKGHDFYATQTTLAPDGRRIVFGWMAMWESHMPEKEDGWAGALTLPRELRLKDGKLVMTPVKELEALRVDEGKTETLTVSDATLIAKDASHAEILFSLPTTDATLTFKDAQEQDILSLVYTAETNKFVLRRNDTDEARYGTIQANDTLKYHLFIDTSSVEIFINDGETVFTERYYSESKPAVYLTTANETSVESTVYQLKADAVTYP